MSSILKVDQIQLSNGNTPTAGDLGLNIDGNILQVVQNVSNASVTSTTAGWVNGGFNQTITPSSASSKILVLYNIWCIIYGTGGSHVAWDLVRTVNGVTSGRFANTQYGFSALYSIGTSSHQGTATMQYLDSPNTTSAVTYTPQFNSVNNQQANFGNAGRIGTITLLEIAG